MNGDDLNLLANHAGDTAADPTLAQLQTYVNIMASINPGKRLPTPGRGYTESTLVPHSIILLVEQYNVSRLELDLAAK